MVVSLTKRELEILTLVSQELTSEQIAKCLNISVSTVETHRRNMFKKVEVSSVVGLVMEALKRGWIEG